MNRLLTSLFVVHALACSALSQTTNVLRDKNSRFIESLKVPSGKTLTIESGGSIINNGTATGFTSGLAIGTSAITGGTSGHVLYNNAGTLGGVDLSAVYQALNTNLTTIAALANGTGVLTNNGSGTFSYTATSNGGNGSADSGKLATFDSSGVLRTTSTLGSSAGFVVNTSNDATSLLSISSTYLQRTFDVLKSTTIQFATPSGTGFQNRTITIPATTGTLITTGDTGTVTNTMLAGSIALGKLATTGTASASTYLRGDGAWSSIDLSAYLPLAGGTMTGVLTVPGLNLSSGITGVTNGFVSNSGVTLEFLQAGGSALAFYMANREAYMPADVVFGWGAANWASGVYTTARDLYIGRDAAARLQLGRDHATTTTNQTIKAHDVTTGTGASLDLRGGNGSTAGGTVTISTSATTTPTVRMTVKASGVINVSGMPTSSAGLSSGDLWNDAGTVKIVP